jgi:glutathione S-transferase
VKLYFTPTSPFARKVRIVARERGLTDRIEEIVADPWADAPLLMATNPVVQVPTLIAEDGLPLTDSPVICEYLDMIADGPRLLPTDGAERLRVRRMEVLGDAVMELGVKLVLEGRRPETERSASWTARCARNLGRALDALEAGAPAPETFDMGCISVGAALLWLDFRGLDPEWRASRPALAALVRGLEVRPSFAETAPPAVA